MNRGFITLVGILIAFLLLGFWFVSMYSKSGENKQNQIDQYNQAIDEAENIKKILEEREK